MRRRWRFHRRGRLPVSHLNWGRQILEDLRDADPQALVSLVLERCVTHVPAPVALPDVGEPWVTGDRLGPERGHEARASARRAQKEAVT